ncbi:GLPGLI family protein [Empedobacter falsenii]
MKKILTLFTFSLLATIAFAQKLEVKYQEIVKVNPEEFKGTVKFSTNGKESQIPNDVYDNMIKNMQEPKDFLLTINDNESFYNKVEKIDNQQGRNGMKVSVSFGDSGNGLFKNLTTKEYLKNVKSFQKDYTIKDKLTEYKWQLSRETKKIIGFDVKKATAIIDSIQTTAWYIPTLKYKTGPENYWGLPGLIAEVETEINRGPISGKRIISLTNISTATNTKSIEKPKDKNAISQKEYNKLMNDQRKRFEEMRNSGVNKRD